MKANIICKENCITVKCKKESETLYDVDLNPWIHSMDLQSFTDKVYDYFDAEMETAEISYKELQQICKKVYNSLK